ncbi:MAG: hypothetical protein J6Y58_04250 [Clostridiales bacterium]|nr:hypothetical protein [Clostridiales bacterium]
MKKNMKTILAFALSLSILTMAAGCKRDMLSPTTVAETADSVSDTSSSEKSEDTETSETTKKAGPAVTRYTASYELAIPTGTRVMSDEPDLPEEIVYWDPTRILDQKYTLEEAMEKYAFVADHTTLIYNRCDELSMSHRFRCVDYGSRLFSNENSATCLDPNGNIHEGKIKYLQLNAIEHGSVYTSFEEMAHDPMCYYGTQPFEFAAEEIQLTDDHVIQHITDTLSSREYLYYGKLMGGNLLVVTFENYDSNDPLTEKDIGDFIHYAEVLLDHLEEDNGSEPYIYDKIVDTPFLGGMHITGFNHLGSVNSTSLSLITRPNSDYYSITLIRDPENPEEYGSWEDMGGMRSCKEDYGSQKLYFTVDGVSYLCSFQNRTGTHTDFDSSAELLDFIRENCYVR